MPQGIDDFTLVLPELTDVATCGLQMYDRLDQLWRMIERYKMTVPIAIRVVDNKARCIRAIRGTRDQSGRWHLEDERTTTESLPEGVFEFPLSLTSRDAKGNILKMRLQFGVDGTTQDHSEKA
jgi:hypothetical protein